MLNIPNTDKAIPISGHFLELKKRLWYCCLFFILSFGVNYFFSDKIVYFVATPLLNFTGHKMIYTAISEPFFVYLKVAFAVSIGTSIPFFMLQIYLFIAPGLHPNERWWSICIGIAFFTMFIFGGGVLYYIILPLAISFLVHFNKNNLFDLDLQAKLSDYIEMITQLMIGFGFAFELPVLLIVLAKIGIINHIHLQKFRRFAIVIIFIIAAIITPPDVLSQLILGGLMMIFYEITILICKLVENRT
jgi:sec-independent protein translocase protein TatC